MSVNDEEDSLDRLLQETVAGLQAAKGDDALVSRAIRQYLLDGSALQLSPFDLWGYFAISSPGLPERAGFDEPQSQRAVEMFSALADELFEGK